MQLIRFRTARYHLMPGCLLLVLMFGCNRIFYYPDGNIRTTPKDAQLRFEDVFFSSSDGTRLHGWFLPAVGSARGTVLHLHGNAANISSHYSFIKWLPTAGYNVFTFDYRGYGQSSGSITRDGSIRDAEAALDYLQTRSDVDKSRIVVFGQSLGAAIATVLCAKRHEHIVAVAIDSAFTAYREVARYHVNRNALLFLVAWWYPLGIEKGHDPIDCVSRISPTPLLIMHGKYDRVVPWQMGQRLFDAARDPKELWLIETTDHTQVWFDNPAMARFRLSGFFDHAISRVR